MVHPEGTRESTGVNRPRRNWWKKIMPVEVGAYAQVQMKQCILNHRRAIGETILPKDELTPMELEMLENLRTIVYMKAVAFNEALNDLATADWYDPETMYLMETVPPSPYVMVVRADNGAGIKSYGPKDAVEEDFEIMRLKSGSAPGRPLEGLICEWWRITGVEMPGGKEEGEP